MVTVFINNALNISRIALFVDVNYLCQTRITVSVSACAFYGPVSLLDFASASLHTELLKKKTENKIQKQNPKRKIQTEKIYMTTTTTTTVIIVGCGAREHAIAQSIVQANPMVKLCCIGAWVNPGIDELTTKYICAPHWRTGFDSLLKIGRLEHPLVVVGPEKPLAEGLVDCLENEYGIPCVGPTMDYARVETSKSFLRKLMDQDPQLKPHSPLWTRCDTLDKVNATLDQWDASERQVVIKPDGLTGGKGVQVQGIDFESITAAKEYCSKIHGSIVIEERLVGHEFTLMSFTDGISFKHMPVVQDFKRLYEGGPNTGGMGSISFAGGRPPFLSKEDVKLARRINERVVTRLNELIGGHRTYKGILYGSFIKTDTIKVIEYNARFGDPEVINVLSHLRSNLLTIFQAIVDENLGKLDVEWDLSSNTVVKYLVPYHYPAQRPPGMLRLKLHRVTRKNPRIYLAGINKKKYYEEGYVMTGSRAVALLEYGNNNHTELEARLNSYFSFFDEETVSYRDTLIQPELHNQDNQDPVTYKTAGVDVDKANQAVQDIKTAVTSTWTSAVTGQFGDFGGSFRLRNEVLVASTDGVGTKTELVLSVLGHKDGFFQLGQDIVNHCVNDILVQFARPLFFLDYFAQAKLEPQNLKFLVSGMAKACSRVQCAILGGETAEMPGIYKPKTCDIVGTIVGRKIPNLQIPTVTQGDIVIALKSSGPHTNGYTLIRQLIKQQHVDKEIIRKLGLCNVHRCYLDAFHHLLDEGIVPGAMCHITGGGLIDNPSRVMPTGLSIHFHNHLLTTFPEPFATIQKWGNLSSYEMKRTFNCGIGFLFVVKPEQTQQTLAALKNDNAFICGIVTSS